MSSTLQPLPSRCAAMPSSAPIVTTPVPPMPVTRMLYGSAALGTVGLGQAREVERLRLLRLAQRAAFDRHERRAEALHARIVLVARRLVDRALAAELGLHRRDRHAVRLHAAIAAAFAHQLVDDDALGRVRELAALAPPALLRRAGLVVEQHRDARNLAQLALHGVELVAMVDADVAGEVAGRIFVRLVADDDDALARLRPRPASRSSAGVSGPSIGWPPVIATASL